MTVIISRPHKTPEVLHNVFKIEEMDGCFRFSYWDGFSERQEWVGGNITVRLIKEGRNEDKTV